MLRRLIRISRRSSRAGAHYECRRCGTTVETPRGGCSACDSSEIARYDV